jgi:hypothetical protein
MASDRDLFRSEPVWSTLRFGFDLTPGAAAPGGSILSGNFAGAAQVDRTLFAFSYGISDTDAVKAGFGRNTKPRRDHTVLDRAGLVPIGGAMEIESISIQPQMILRPTSLATIDSRIDDNPGDQDITADWIGLRGAAVAKELRTLLLQYLDRAGVFFWSYGEGEKRNYLGSLAMLTAQGELADDGGLAHHVGSPLVLPEKISWTMTGDAREFRVGYELKQDIHNPQFAVAATFPATSEGLAIATTAAALGVTSDGINPPNAGAWFAVLDLKVYLQGFRREILKGGMFSPGL